MAHISSTPEPMRSLKHSGHNAPLEIEIPGDKSISHRSIMFGLLSLGRTYVKDILEGEDVLSTIKICRELGATINHIGDGEYEIYGVGIGNLKNPQIPLDFGNSGTGVRLFMGIIAGNDITSTLIGDASLCSRPMDRVSEPLSQLGARFTYLENDGKLPCTLTGTLNPLPATIKQTKASAQIKSAILLAALTTPGIIRYHENTPTRDHTERMLKGFGADISIDDDGNGGKIIAIKGGKQLYGQDIQVPSDPSSAAFFIASALITPNSDVTLRNILMNETRIGVITTWLEMGANIEIFNERESGGEKLADLRVKSSQLTGVCVPHERAPSMIDEYPILAVTSAFAKGTTHMQGLDELRVKESDRLQAVYDGLVANGVDARIQGDDLIVKGSENIKGGGLVKTHLDHRIAMSFLIMGLATQNPVSIDDATMINTSFPSFMEKMKEFGAIIEKNTHD